MSFRIGQEVICIDDRWVCAALPYRGACVPDGVIAPTKKSIYTIWDIVHFPGYEVEFLKFCELKVGTWIASAFRPLIEKDLPAELTALLDIKNHKPLPDHQPKRQKVSHDLCGND